jgi:hypothetical protein
MIPAAAEPDSAAFSPETSQKYPITVTANNQLAERALDKAIANWTNQARSWCEEQLGAFRFFTIIVSLSIFLFCMAVSALRAWQDISV